MTNQRDSDRYPSFMSMSSRSILKHGKTFTIHCEELRTRRLHVTEPNFKILHISMYTFLELMRLTLHQGNSRHNEITKIKINVIRKWG